MKSIQYIFSFKTLPLIQVWYFNSNPILNFTKCPGVQSNNSMEFSKCHYSNHATLSHFCPANHVPSPFILFAHFPLYLFLTEVQPPSSLFPPQPPNLIPFRSPLLPFLLAISTITAIHLFYTTSPLRPPPPKKKVSLPPLLISLCLGFSLLV